MPTGPATVQAEPGRSTLTAARQGDGGGDTLISDFNVLSRRSQLELVHLAIFGWPLDQHTPTDHLLASTSLQEATAKLIRTDRVRGFVGESSLEFARLDRKSQLDIVHLALFGWPMDHLTPVDDLLASPSLRDAVHKLIGTERARFVMRDTAPLWPTDKWVCADFFDLRIWVNLNDSYVSRGVLSGDWENAEVGFVLDQLAPGDAMVDVGANVGVYALQAARVVGPEGCVFAFEPQADTFTMLSRSVGDNGFSDRVVLHNLALGDHDGPATVWRHHANNPGASFITSEPLQGAGNATQLMRLDSLGIERPVKLLKMDIEGFEPLLVAGAGEFLRRHHPVIVTEWFPRAMMQVGRSSPEEYFDQLCAFGYDVRLMEGRKLGEPLTKKHPAFADFDADPINIACMPRNTPKQTNRRSKR